VTGFLLLGPTALQLTALHCTALQYKALHCTALQCSTAVLYSSALQQCSTAHCTALHCSTKHCTVLQYKALHCTAVQSTALYCSTPHCTAPVDSAEQRQTDGGIALSTQGPVQCSAVQCSAVQCSAVPTHTPLHSQARPDAGGITHCITHYTLHMPHTTTHSHMPHTTTHSHMAHGTTHRHTWHMAHLAHVTTQGGVFQTGCFSICPSSVQACRLHMQCSAVQCSVVQCSVVQCREL
jgi:hypothetical protein